MDVIDVVAGTSSLLFTQTMMKFFKYRLCKAAQAAHCLAASLVRNAQPCSFADEKPVLDFEGPKA